MKKYWFLFLLNIHFSNPKIINSLNVIIYFSQHLLNFVLDFSPLQTQSCRANKMHNNYDSRKKNARAREEQYIAGGNLQLRSDGRPKKQPRRTERINFPRTIEGHS